MQALKLIFSLILLSACKAQIIPPKIKSGGVISTSLCADNYVLHLFEPKYIKALSWQSDSKLSNAPKGLRGKIKARDDLETILALKPALVIFGAGEGIKSKPLLREHGIDFINLDWAEDFEGVEKNISKIKNSAQKNAIGILDKNYNEFRPHANGVRKINKAKILYLSSSGATAGKNTYIDAIIKKAGGENIIKQTGWFAPDIEYLVGIKPDLVISSFFDDGYVSASRLAKNNKVLQDIINSADNINIPGRLWPCAAPTNYKAVNMIKSAIRELE